MSTNTLRPGLTAAMAAGRALLAAGWIVDSVDQLADGSTERHLLHPSGREITAITDGGRDSTELTMTGLTLEQAAGAVTGAGLTAPASTVCLACKHDVSQHVEDHIGCRVENGLWEVCRCPFPQPAKPDPRAKLVAGLRALADFYENNPTMPLPAYPQLLVGSPRGRDETDEEGVERVTRAAGILGVDAVIGDGNAHAERQFGGLKVRVYAHTKASMDAYYALTSYSGSVQPAGSAS